jgi:hypothetical protein
LSPSGVVTCNDRFLWVYSAIRPFILLDYVSNGFDRLTRRAATNACKWNERPSAADDAPC